jgi:hypothetical protein
MAGLAHGCSLLITADSKGASPLQESEMFENNWRDLYRDAILELDLALFKVRLQAAEDAIKTRALYALVSREERKQMDDALSTIRRLKIVDR